MDARDRRRLHSLANASFTVERLRAAAANDEWLFCRRGRTYAILQCGQCLIGHPNQICGAASLSR